MTPDSYRWPFIFSVFFHTGLLALLLFSFHDYLSYTASQQSGASQNNPVIQAVAVNQQQVENQKSKVKTEQKKLDFKQAHRLKPEAKMAVKQQQQEQVKAEQPKTRELTTPMQQTETLKEKPIEQPTLQTSKPVVVAAEKKPLPTKQTVTPKLKQAMERELQKKLAQESAEQALASAVASEANSEAKEAVSQASAAHVQGELDKYKALIVQSIGEHWLIPDDLRQDLSCELLIRVAPEGDVLSVEIARSSGDAVLDRSARAAVFKSSPLPVPKEAAVFEKFRELKLTVRPETFL